MLQPCPGFGLARVIVSELPGSAGLFIGTIEEVNKIDWRLQVKTLTA